MEESYRPTIIEDEIEELPIEEYASEEETQHESKSDKSEKKKVGIKEVSAEFGNNTTAHGLNRVVMARRLFVKFCWTVIFIGPLVYWVFSTKNLLKEYFEYPITMNLNGLGK